MNRRSLLASAGVTLAFGSAGGTLAAAAVPAPDPMILMLEEYRRLNAAYNALPEDISAEDEARIAAETWGRIYWAEAQPVPTSMAGAVAGLRMVLEEQDHTMNSQFADTITRAVLAFLEGRAS